MKLILFCLLVFSSFNIYGQTIGSYNLSPAGSSVMNDQGGLYFAIGEPMNSEIGEGDFMIAQGFLQVAIQGSLSDTYEILLETVKVFPNPVAESLTLELQNKKGQHEIILFSVGGEKLESKIISSRQSTLDFSNLNSGTYFLQVLTDSESVGVYTIIKQ